MGESGSVDAVPQLVALLTGSRSPSFESPVPSALRQHVSTGDTALRAACAVALGRLGDARALPALITALAAEDAAATALQNKDQTGPMSYYVPELPANQIEDALASLLAAIKAIKAPDKTAQLLKALRDGGSVARRMGAAKLLAYRDKSEAEMPLIAALADQTPVVRAAAAAALGHLQSVSAVDALSRASGDAHELVRETAALALEEISARSGAQVLRAATEQAQGSLDSIPLEKLADTLRTGNRLQRKLAAEELGQRAKDPTDRRLELLEIAARDEWTEVRVVATTQLGTIQPPQDLGPGRRSAFEPATPEQAAHAIKLLVAALADKEPDVRKSALDQIPPESEHVATFIQMLEDSDENVRRHAVWKLGKLKDPRAVDALIKCLHDQRHSQYWKNEVMEGLRDSGDPRAVPALIGALENRYTDASPDEAARVLGAIRDPRAIEPLIKEVRIRQSRRGPGQNEGWAKGEQGEFIRALGRLRATEGIEPILITLESEERAEQPDKFLLETSREALAAITGG